MLSEIVWADLTTYIQLGVTFFACYFMWDISKTMIKEARYIIASDSTGVLGPTATAYPLIHFMGMPCGGVGSRLVISSASAIGTAQTLGICVRYKKSLGIECLVSSL